MPWPTVDATWGELGLRSSICFDDKAMTPGSDCRPIVVVLRVRERESRVLARTIARNGREGGPRAAATASGFVSTAPSQGPGRLAGQQQLRASARTPRSESRPTSRCTARRAHWAAELVTNETLPERGWHDGLQPLGHVIDGRPPQEFGQGREPQASTRRPAEPPA